jgi:hypothetical protein
MLKGIAIVKNKIGIAMDKKGIFLVENAQKNTQEAPFCSEHYN